MIVKERFEVPCRTCGAPLRGDEPLGGHCLTCLLDAALDEEEESAVRIELFGHYELARNEDGTPLELGRGAMGVTYKAVDVDLRCPVTLKVICQKYVGDELTRLRFLREARAAASIRHANVASVFHFGRTGESYFYAMEFVEGETLENLIKRSGRLEVRLALEIAAQVTAGLAAVHRQKLVHRDIKPSNIMVSFKEGAVTAKIIDLGLAKAVNESGSQTAISTPGAFAGTPEFASPEQFAGVGVDIRSDLYSLGVVLWEMVTGNPPFRGSAAEVMYQHQHAPLPLEQLEGVPQPAVVLVEVLLEKDARRRFQNPAELLRVMPAITDAIDRGQTITLESLRQLPAADPRAVARKPPARLGPEMISIARLPVTGSELFGREEDLAFLDDAWENPDVNVVSIVAWAGVGKSTMINHWLRGMAARHYRSAQVVYGWSFYRQGSSGSTSSGDEFLNAALRWFGDPDPQMGTAWEKSERLASLIAHRRTLLLLDGLEPLQFPPGPHEGRLRDPGLQALLGDLAAFNKGLCVITTRIPITDIADYERTSAMRRDLEQLSSNAGAKLLRALGVKGDEVELRSASHEFNGHCLALTLLGSYLSDASHGDVRCRKEVSASLTRDVRQGIHARKVMESYQTWLGEGPELSVLRILGLFDRPVDPRALEALLSLPPIPGVTDALTHLSPASWQTIVSTLRRAKLLAGEDTHNPGYLDAHPLVREYFGEQLRTQRAEGWKECNKRLYQYYKTVAPQLPNNLREMEPLFLAAICGCHAGLFREVLQQIYIPRLQRGNASFAASVLGARGELLSVLAHFFEQTRLGAALAVGIEGQDISAEDELFILTQARLYLTATRGFTVPEVRRCYQRGESLCHSINRPLLLYQTLNAHWHDSLLADKLSATLQIAKQLYSSSQELNEAALMIGSHASLATTLCYLGDFEAASQHATHGVRIWRSGGTESQVEVVVAPIIICLCFGAISGWHLGEVASCRASIAEAISLAKLNDTHTLATALLHAAMYYHLERSLAEVNRLTSELIELSTRENFAYWLRLGKVYRGWASGVCGDPGDGLSCIEESLRESQRSGVILCVPYVLSIKAEVLHLADRTFEALQAIEEAETFVERSEDRWWSAELFRLRGVFLAKLGADHAAIEEAFCKSLSTAKQQKSVSLTRRAEASYAEYCRQREKAVIERAHGIA